MKYDNKNQSIKQYKNEKYVKNRISNITFRKRSIRKILKCNWHITGICHENPENRIKCQKAKYQENPEKEIEYQKGSFKKIQNYI